jgi:hypothetical protein
MSTKGVVVPLSIAYLTGAVQVRGYLREETEEGMQWEVEELIEAGA